MLLWALLTVAIAAGDAQAGYREDAERLVAEPPAGIVIREDLETAIDGLANAARTGRGRKPLASSPLFKTPARAQAIDMALGNFVGHRSRTGLGFSARFAAFAGDADRFPARGENAARDRARGPADASKARRLFQQWLDSGGHRRNLLAPGYAMVSSGVIQKGDHLYAVQIFWAEPAQLPAGAPTRARTENSGPSSLFTALRKLWPK
jgi:uncharacterized protein YkwD